MIPPIRRRSKKRNRKCKEKTVLAIEGSGVPCTGKKAKTEDPGKEVAACADCREAVAAGKAGKADIPYCKIHRTKGHDLQECHQVEQLVKKQKAEYEKRDKERDQDGIGGKGRGGRGGRPRKVARHQGKPAKGHEKKESDDKSDKEDEEETNDQELQKAIDALCIDGGAYLHSSHHKLKHWA